jgi:hypothetical protein
VKAVNLYEKWMPIDASEVTMNMRAPKHENEKKPKEIKKMELAKAYVLDQPYTKLYPPEEALEKGTIFPDLYKPY